MSRLGRRRARQQTQARSFEAGQAVPAPVSRKCEKDREAPAFLSSSRIRGAGGAPRGRTRGRTASRLQTRSALAPGRQREATPPPNNGFNRLLPIPRSGLQSRGPNTSHSLVSGAGARPGAGPGNSASLPGFGGRRRLGGHLSASCALAQGSDCDDWVKERLACQARRAEHRALRPAHARRQAKACGQAKLEEGGREQLIRWGVGVGVGRESGTVLFLFSSLDFKFE